MKVTINGGNNNVDCDHKDIYTFNPINDTLINYISKDPDTTELLKVINRLTSENLDLRMQVRYYEKYIDFLEKRLSGKITDSDIDEPLKKDYECKWRKP